MWDPQSLSTPLRLHGRADTPPWLGALAADLGACKGQRSPGEGVPKPCLGVKAPAGKAASSVISIAATAGECAEAAAAGMSAGYAGLGCGDPARGPPAADCHNSGPQQAPVRRAPNCPMHVPGQLP